MRYYVVADVHGYYSALINALGDKGYFDYQGDKKLVVCGDLLDRGKEALKVQDFILGLMAKDQVVLIRGNHEDLFESMILDYGCVTCRPYTNNGTYDSALQLTGLDKGIAYAHPSALAELARQTPFYKDVIPSMLNYYETPSYIFVHGWIPSYEDPTLRYNPDWRTLSTDDQWEQARWRNGIDASRQVREAGKTIVCGHWHCSYGHYMYEYKGSEFGDDADFSPYYGNGIIAIDACAAHTGKINCLVIDD